MDTRQLLSDIRSKLESVYGERLKRVVLFGSVARGDAGPHSDIDVLVVLDNVEDYGLYLRTNIEALYPLASELDRRISAKPVSEEEFEKFECPLYRHAHEEGIAA